MYEDKDLIRRREILREPLTVSKGFS